MPVVTEITICETCFYCLADTGIDPDARYVLLTKSSDSQSRSIAHLLCWQTAVTKVRKNESSE